MHLEGWCDGGDGPVSVSRSSELLLGPESQANARWERATRVESGGYGDMSGWKRIKKWGGHFLGFVHETVSVRLDTWEPVGRDLCLYHCIIVPF